jgi:hypothetical protein
MSTTYCDDLIRVCDDVCFDTCMSTVSGTFPNGGFTDADIDALVALWHEQMLDRLIENAIDAHEDGLGMYAAIGECIEACLDAFIAAAAPIRQQAEVRVAAQADEVAA